MDRWDPMGRALKVKISGNLAGAKDNLLQTQIQSLPTPRKSGRCIRRLTLLNREHKYKLLQEKNSTQEVKAGTGHKGIWNARPDI